MDSAAAPRRLERPLLDLARWTRHFQAAEIPILPDTALTLEAMRANEDGADANMLGEMISGDPLMTLKVMAYQATHRSRKLITDAETVTAALVLMGISPFFRAFGPQRTVEEHLQDMPEALDGLYAVLKRARRAANFALGFAVHRLDPDAAIAHQAALLHDMAEMLLWCHAPALALEIRQRQLDDPTLRSSIAQKDVLGIELADLQQALMKAWRLPELLIRITDDRHAEHPAVKTVALAIRVARHTASGWDNAALPDDVRDIGELLNLITEPTLHLLHEIDD